MINPIEWLDNKIRILDQTQLPQKVVYHETGDYHDVLTAIKQLKVRGAPAIGVAAAYGIALGALNIKAGKKDAFLAQLDTILRAFAATRPTASNLFRAVARMRRIALAEEYPESIVPALIEVAINIHNEEKSSSRKISQLGADLIQDNSTILTHCNTGPLATAGYGTALGIILYCAEQRKKINVIATETRPLLQGARLTAWELQQVKIPFTLIADSAAGYFIKTGRVNYVIVGADRIALNGDTANKIGTYTLGVLAHENEIPFYVAAPTSTIDAAIASGEAIQIEERDPSEITTWHDFNLAPQGTKAANPAFDITPCKYISAIITEKGTAEQPFEPVLSIFAKERI